MLRSSFFFIISLLIALPAFGGIITLKADGSGDYVTIQEAINEIEVTLNKTDPVATLEELENAKDMAEILNCM